MLLRNFARSEQIPADNRRFEVLSQNLAGASYVSTYLPTIQGRLLNVYLDVFQFTGKPNESVIQALASVALQLASCSLILLFGNQGP